MDKENISNFVYAGLTKKKIKQFWWKYVNKRKEDKTETITISIFVNDGNHIFNFARVHLQIETKEHFNLRTFLYLTIR